MHSITSSWFYRVCIAVALLWVFGMVPGHAQTCPAKPVCFVVGFAPGGAPGILRQLFYIDNTLAYTAVPLTQENPTCR